MYFNTRATAGDIAHTDRGLFISCPDQRGLVARVAEFRIPEQREYHSFRSPSGLRVESVRDAD